MTDANGSCVFVAVPVYRGTDFVAETLRSILSQTHRDLRVLISVDGDDQASADACRPFLADDRVRMIVQERSRGWAGNTNRLIEACDGDYFTYWQQDDLCDPTYLEKLVAALRSHPGAACAYSDVRWFGRSRELVSLPSVVGSTRERIGAQLETLHWIPLRAVVPVGVLRRVGPVLGIDGDTFFADVMWGLRLAAEGDLVRVPEALYHKRDHARSASHESGRATPFTAPEAWTRLGLRIYEEMAPYVEGADRAELALAVADRLVMHRPGRWFAHDPLADSAAEAAAFAMAFFRRLESVTRLRPPLDDADDGSDASLERLRAQLEAAPPGSILRVVARGLLVGPERRRAILEARERGALRLEAGSGGQPSSLLIDGWSEPEEWGTWSDGHRARLWLPVPDDGASWRVRLVAQPYLRRSSRQPAPRIIVRRDDDVLLDHRHRAGGQLPGFFVAGAGHAGEDAGVTLELALPDAASPAAEGAGPDERRLSLGLVALELAREAAGRRGIPLGDAVSASRPAVRRARVGSGR